jgi:hypothetical protein
MFQNNNSIINISKRMEDGRETIGAGCLGMVE